jgi:hypothetical protein
MMTLPQTAVAIAGGLSALLVLERDKSFKLGQQKNFPCLKMESKYA